jgi:lysozyme
MSGRLQAYVIEMGRELTAEEEPTALSPDVQRGVRNIRTDLDSFSPAEISSLIMHGYSEARFALKSMGIIVPPESKPWDPLSDKHGELKREDFQIQDTRRRRWNFFSWRHWASWLTLLAGLTWAAVLIGAPAVFTNYRALTQLVVLQRDLKKSDLAVAVAVQKSTRTFVDVSSALGTVAGIDVWKFTKPIDWQTVAQQGIRFAFVRADQSFAKTWASARAAGLATGSYFAFQFSKDPVDQANEFVARVGPDAFGKGTLPPVADVEQWPFGPVDEHSPVDEYSPDQRAVLLIQFLQKLETASHKVPMIYTTAADWEKLIGDRPEFSRYALWLGAFHSRSPRIPLPWSRWSFLQTSQDATVKGISGPVDFNNFNGTGWAFEEFLITSEQHSP